jgi:glyoxylase-like metal-dependent hydrolase (beta-lactamase superfamily II)
MKRPFLPAILLPAVLLPAILTVAAPVSAQPQLIAVRYGLSRFPAASVFERPPVAGMIPFGWMFYVYVSCDETVLIDTGFSDPDTAAYFGVTLRDPVDILAEIGIAPDAVTTIIVTHHHVDHAGDLGRYPNARVVMQRDAFAALATSWYGRRVAERLRAESRIELFDDERVLDPLPIRIIAVGGHSVGSSVVEVERFRRTYLLTGDECYVAKNLLEMNPIGSVYDRERNTDFLETYSDRRVTLATFHDPDYVGEGLWYRRVF